MRPWLPALLVICACGGHPGPAKTAASAGDADDKIRVGLTPDSYQALYLEAADLTPLQQVQDSRMQGADPGDRSFAMEHGLYSGLAAWMNQDTSAPVWRLVDIRTVFPTAEEASRYLHEDMASESEGQPRVADAPLVGQECEVYGGDVDMPDGMGGTIKLTNYFYIFRVGNVDVKLYVAQGMDATVHLTAEDVQPLAQKIVDRIHAQAR